MTDTPSATNSSPQDLGCNPAEQPDSLETIDPELVDACAKCRPRVSESDWVHVGSGIVVWGEQTSPGALHPLAALVWPLLDGSVSVAELTADLDAVLDTERTAIEQFLSLLTLDLAATGLATGLEPVAEVLRNRHPESLTQATRSELGEHAYEIDGIRHLDYVFDLSLGDLERTIDGEVSVAELIPPESCMGQKLHLADGVPDVPLLVEGRPIAIRTNDEVVRDWLTESGPIATTKGPVQAFLFHEQRVVGRPLYRVYDGRGHLSCASTDRRRAATTAVGLLTSERLVDQFDEGPLLNLRALVRDERVVLAPAQALDHAPALLRRLERVGISVAPASRLLLEWDAAAVQIATPFIGLDELPISEDTSPIPRLTGRFSVAGSFVTGNREGPVHPAHIVMTLATDTPSHSAGHRTRTLSALASVAERCPCAVAFRTQRSASAIVRSIEELFDA